MTTLWLLDLDDTLFEASAGMLYSIHLKMNAFMMDRLSIDDKEASRLRTHYWSTYGATFLGLWLHHGVDPREFLAFAHDFDPSPFVRYEQWPVPILRRLPGKKIVFTNGPRNYAESVLHALGAEHAVDGLVTSTEMRAMGVWRPKPSRQMLLQTCRSFGVSPSRTVLVDDSVMNLKCAHAEGIKTVWCTGYRQRHGKLAHRIALPYIDFTITHIRELLRLKV